MRRRRLVAASCWLVCTAACFGTSNAPPDSGSPAGDDAQAEAGPVGDATLEASADAPTPTFVQGVVDAPAEAQTEGGVDATVDAPPAPSADAAVDSPVEASADAPPEATAEAGAQVVLLVAVNGAAGAVGASYASGAWTSLSPLGSDVFAPGGGGVAVLADGTGVGVVRGNTNTSLETATWAGAWSTVTVESSAQVNLIGLPVVTAAGVAIPFENGITNYPLLVDELTASTSSWTMNESTNSANNNQTAPTLALTLAGDPVLLAATSTKVYTWSLRTAGTWSAPVTIAGLAAPGGIGLGAGVVATGLVGVDQIIGVFIQAADGGGAPLLQSAAFASGAWSSPIPVVTDLPSTLRGTPMAIAALPDGRAALAYVASTGAVKVGFWSGTAWGAFQAVSSVTATTSAEAPAIAIARGASGAEIELAYIDGSSHLGHTRLVDEAAWTWTTPVAIDAVGTYGMVSIAVGP